MLLSNSYIVLFENSRIVILERSNFEALIGIEVHFKDSFSFTYSNEIACIVKGSVW